MAFNFESHRITYSFFPLRLASWSHFYQGISGMTVAVALAWIYFSPGVFFVSQETVVIFHHGLEGGLGI